MDDKGTTTGEDDTPAPRWWENSPGAWWMVHWSLEPLRGDQLVEDASVADAIARPDTNCFRIPFANKEAAVLFVAEIQRYLGSLALERLAQMDTSATVAALILGDALPGVAEIHRRLIHAAGDDYAGWEEWHARIIERLRAVANMMEETGAYGHIGMRE